MIYLDTSAALAHLLSEDKRPPDQLWDETLITSRLLDYEVWTRLNKLSLSAAQREAAASFLGRIAFVELIPEINARAREPFPVPVRTLDALHLASAAFLLEEGVELQLATYDSRMSAAARTLRIPLFPLS